MMARSNCDNQVLNLFNILAIFYVILLTACSDEDGIIEPSNNPPGQHDDTKEEQTTDLLVKSTAPQSFCPGDPIVIEGEHFLGADEYNYYLGEVLFDNNVNKIDVLDDRVILHSPATIESGFVRILDGDGSELYRSEKELQRNSDCLGDVSVSISGVECLMENTITFDPEDFAPSRTDSTLMPLNVNFKPLPAYPSNPEYTSQIVEEGGTRTYRLSYRRDDWNDRTSGPDSTYEMRVHFTADGGAPFRVEFLHSFFFSIRNNSGVRIHKFSQHLTIDLPAMAGNSTTLQGDEVLAALNCETMEERKTVHFTGPNNTVTSHSIPGGLVVHPDARITIQLARP